MSNDLGSKDSSPDSLPNSEPAFQFGMLSLVYTMAMLGASLAVFGMPGMLVGTVVVLYWALVLSVGDRKGRLLRALFAAFILLCAACMLLPAVQSAREAARRSQCSNNLKQIALALHNYHDIYKSFPPAYIADANGRPMHSWRVLILPFMGYQELYDQYRFDEPWDGPNNRKLNSKVVDAYRCPANQSRTEHTTHTNYVAIIGPNTIWPGAESTSFADILDGTSNTVMVIESKSADIHWMEPRDVDLNEATRLLASTDWEDAVHVREGFFYRTITGRNVAFADGACQFIPLIPEQSATKYFGINDGIVDPAVLDAPPPATARKPQYGNWLRLGVFLILVFLPLPWVWISPRREKVKL
ncbi:MAG: DUF1559 domain-containing protein [Planctomycetales bacterium]|nr:DUF1559 domain-containing protein [Planctomycetales bacterium]